MKLILEIEKIRVQVSVSLVPKEYLAPNVLNPFTNIEGDLVDIDQNCPSVAQAIATLRNAVIKLEQSCVKDSL